MAVRMHDEITDKLRAAYDGKVAEREASTAQQWKVVIRQGFLEMLRAEGKSSLLEVGAGTGVHGLFFKNAGLNVVATDLSQAMVDSCRAKGLDARRLDFLSLDFEDQFDAVFAMNCFLHVPPDDLLEVLRAMRRVLKPEGLLFWGQYGGVDHQGALENDHYQPKRFFSMLSDSAMQAGGGEVFKSVDFETIEVSRNWEQHFQSSIWRR
jgi:SAM-dependent methyltransferase